MPEDQKETKSFIKHNKKRNTGLLFEFLTRFVAESAMFDNGDNDPNLYLEMMVRYFAPNTELGRELEIIRSLADRRYSSKELAARSIYEFKNKLSKINHEQSNIEKSNLIKEINYSIGMELYSIDIPNYRLYTSIYGLCEAVRTKNYAAESQYEDLVLNNLTEQKIHSQEKEELSELEYSDAVVSIMINKLNERFEKYEINESQKKVIQNYVGLQQGTLTEESYRNYLSFRFTDVYNALVVLESDKRLSDPQTRERISQLKSIYKSYNKIESVDDMTSLVIDGLSFIN